MLKLCPQVKLRQSFEAASHPDSTAAEMCFLQ